MKFKVGESAVFQASLEIGLQNSGMRQCEFSRRSGLTQAAISQFLSGKREPSLGSLVQICHALKLTPNDMLGFHSKKQIRLNENLANLKRKIEKAIEVLEE